MYVVFKGIPEMNISRVVVALSRNGWMNEELTKDWVKRVWGTLNFGRRLMLTSATPLKSGVASTQTNTDVRRPH